MVPRWWCCCFEVIGTNGGVTWNKTVAIFGGTKAQWVLLIGVPFAQITVLATDTNLLILDSPHFVQLS